MTPPLQTEGPRGANHPLVGYSKIISVAGTMWFSASQTLAIRHFHTEGYKIGGSAIVLMSEMAKLCAVATMCSAWLRKTPFPGPVRWGFLVNAVLYIGTNLLSYVILESLDAGLYTVLMQHKVLLIVALSTIVFRRSYTWVNWLGCIMLVCGLALVNFDPNGNHSVPAETLLLVLAQGACSSFSSVWMEKMMKRGGDSHGDQADALYDYFTDSIQMYAFSLPFYAALATTATGAHTLPHIYSAGLVINGACCGIFIGSVLKYFSAATRTFVQGATVVIVVWASVVFSDEPFTWRLAAGTVLIISCIAAFGAQPNKN